MTHTDTGALLKLADELNAFFNFINEPPQYEDQRMVRDYRHELAQLWMPLHTKINAALGASQGNAGGEAVAWQFISRDDSVRGLLTYRREVADDWEKLGHTARPLYALSSPVKTGGEAEASNGSTTYSPIGRNADGIEVYKRDARPVDAGAAQAAVSPGTIERMVTDAMDTARLEAVEECAKVADDHTPAKHDGTLAAHVTGNTIAKAIRALSVSSAQGNTQ